MPFLFIWLIVYSCACVRVRGALGKTCWIVVYSCWYFPAISRPFNGLDVWKSNNVWAVTSLMIWLKLLPCCSNIVVCCAGVIQV